MLLSRHTEQTMQQVFARSGLACKKGLAPANKVGVIDSDYRGEIKVALHNHNGSGDALCVDNGERIAQISIVPYLKADFEVVENLEDTERGEGGFGSTKLGNKTFRGGIAFLKICVFDIQREYMVQKTFVLSFCYFS